MEQREFSAMGGAVEVHIVDGPAVAGERIETIFHDYENILSRFLPWSELERMHAASPAPHHASPVLFEAVAEAVRWARDTGGLFDPTVRDALEASGYDRPLEEIPRHAAAITLRQRRAATTWHDIRLQDRGRIISLPAGLRLDLGGIGKGFTVDRAYAAAGSRNIMIDAAGDLYAAGDGPDGDGWRIGVQDPFDSSRDIATIRIRDRAVATSGSTGRWWMRGDTRYHHLIDARTRRCASSDLATATVVARDATHADVLAKCVFLLGEVDGLALADRFGAAVLLVTACGDVVTDAKWKEYAE